MWNMDYTAFVMWRVLHDANWGEIALPDEKRRSELVVEFFNSMLADNCGKAVHNEYPVVFEQVKLTFSHIFTLHSTGNCLLIIKVFRLGS